MISRIYDPLGLAATFLLKGKINLQDICENNYNNVNVPSNFTKDWESWKVLLHLLENVVMKRYFEPPGFDKIACCSLHHFSDAGQNGYGQMSYLWLMDKKGSIHCCPVMRKSRVAPTKFVSIPRLELTAAAFSVKVSVLLRKELTIHPIINKSFYTGSQVVLGYMNSNAKRFKVSVANRFQLIRQHSEPSQ